MYVINYY